MALYQSCSSDMRSKYALLVADMKRRFTPIRLTAVQAQLFHNRQQQERETAAQDLQKLYNLAYAGATSEGPQAERMGQTLLANQFVTGLRANLKRKLSGTEGSLDELVLKARFEEAKTRTGRRQAKDYMPSRTQRPTGGSSSMPMTTSPPSVRSTQSSSPVRAQTRLTCYNCGLDGHMARNCPKVLVNGIPTQALINSGSPATVVSLEFVIYVFVKEKEEHKTPAQETFEKFHPPSVLLKAYRGHKLNILSQVSSRLTRRSWTVEAVVLVQEGALHELLLGTDLQSKLGFALVAEEMKLVDLLNGQEKDFARRSPSSAGGASQSPKSPSSVEGPTDDSSGAGCTLQTSGENVGVASSGELTDEEPTPFGIHLEVDNLEEATSC